MQEPRFFGDNSGREWTLSHVHMWIIVPSLGLFGLLGNALTILVLSKR